MRSKIIAILIILILITGMTGCSFQSHEGSSGLEVMSGSVEQETTEKKDSNGKNGSTDSTEFSNTKTDVITDPLTADQLSISYFEWDVREKIIEKALCYTLNLRNRSPFPILSTEITYKTRNNASDRSLKQFDQFMSSHREYISQDEDNRNVILIGKSEAYVKVRQYLYNVPITIGIHSMTWYDSPNYDQFILMQPSVLSLGLVKNNILYSCHYNFIDKTWSVDDNPAKLNQWPDNPLAELVPKPSCDYFRVSTDQDSDYLVFTVYGISEDAFKEYVETVKDKGFTKKQNKGKRYYSAEDKKQNTIDIMYEKSTWNMEVSVNL